MREENRQKKKMPPTRAQAGMSRKESKAVPGNGMMDQKGSNGVIGGKLFL